MKECHKTTELTSRLRKLSAKAAAAHCLCIDDDDGGLAESMRSGNLRFHIRSYFVWQPRCMHSVASHICRTPRHTEHRRKEHFPENRNNCESFSFWFMISNAHCIQMVSYLRYAAHRIPYAISRFICFISCSFRRVRERKNSVARLRSQPAVHIWVYRWYHYTGWPQSIHLLNVKHAFRVSFASSHSLPLHDSARSRYVMQERRKHVKYTKWLDSDICCFFRSIRTQFSVSSLSLSLLSLFSQSNRC